jgi:hypothetical protein
MVMRRSRRFRRQTVVGIGLVLAVPAALVAFRAVQSFLEYSAYERSIRTISLDLAPASLAGFGSRDFARRLHPLLRRTIEYGTAPPGRVAVQNGSWEQWCLSSRPDSNGIDCLVSILSGGPHSDLIEIELSRYLDLYVDASVCGIRIGTPDRAVGGVLNSTCSVTPRVTTDSHGELGEFSIDHYAYQYYISGHEVVSLKVHNTNVSLTPSPLLPR